MSDSKRCRIGPDLSNSQGTMPLLRGKKVWLHGLHSASCLNGQSGLLGTFDVPSQRWFVHLQGRLVKVRSEHISAAEPSTSQMSGKDAVDCPANQSEEETEKDAEDQGPTLLLVVRQISGEAMSLNMLAGTQVVELREEIASRVGVWSHKPMRLLAPSGELLGPTDERTLSEAGLIDGSCLTLVRSCSPCGSWCVELRARGIVAFDISHVEDELQVQMYEPLKATGLCVQSEDGFEVDIKLWDCSANSRPVLSFQGVLSKDGRAMIGHCAGLMRPLPRSRLIFKRSVL